MPFAQVLGILKGVLWLVGWILDFNFLKNGALSSPQKVKLFAEGGQQRNANCIATPKGEPSCSSRCVSDYVLLSLLVSRGSLS